MPVSKKISTKIVYRTDGLEDLYASAADTEKYTFSETFYNEKGDIINEAEFDSDGAVIYDLRNQYDAAGRLQQQQRAYDGSIAETCIFTYNDDNLLLSEKIIYADAGEKTTTYAYNDSKKIQLKTSDDNSGEDPYAEEKFEYNNEHLILHAVYFDKSSQPHYQRKIIYDAETDGKITEEIIYDASTGITTTIKNNTVLAYLDKKLVSRTIRTFDEKEQITSELMEDANGKRLYQYHYDDAGNLVMEERYLRDVIYFKVVSQYNDNGLIQQQTIINPESGSYTEFYDYVFYD